MSFEVHTTPTFERSAKSLAKKHRSLGKDLGELIDSLESNPFQGDELTPGLRKIRMAITSKERGKSGGARIISYTIVVAADAGDVYLLDIYDKADFSTVDVGILTSIIKQLGL